MVSTVQLYVYTQTHVQVHVDAFPTHNITFERILVHIESVCVLLLGEDEPLVHEEDVSVGPCPP